MDELSPLEPCPIRDRIDNAQSRFAWWRPGKRLGSAAGGAASILPWLYVLDQVDNSVR